MRRVIVGEDSDDGEMDEEELLARIAEKDQRRYRSDEEGDGPTFVDPEAAAAAVVDLFDRAAEQWCEALGLPRLQPSRATPLTP